MSAALPPISASKLCIICFNIHHGEGRDGKLDLTRVAAAIRASGAHVAALQEVDRNMARTQRIDVADELARQLGWTAHFEANLRKRDGGEYGNALLTHLPVLECKNTLLPQTRPTEPRGLLQVTLQFQGREIEVLTTHLDSDGLDDERLLQAPAVLAALSQLPPSRPFVLCGDFNDTPKGPAYALLARELSDVWAVLHPDAKGYTIPAHKPKSRIDFFWVSARGPMPTHMQVLASEASDHLPIVAEFELTASLPEC